MTGRTEPSTDSLAKCRSTSANVAGRDIGSFPFMVFVECQTLNYFIKILFPLVVNSASRNFINNLHEQSTYLISYLSASRSKLA